MSDDPKGPMASADAVERWAVWREGWSGSSYSSGRLIKLSPKSMVVAKRAWRGGDRERRIVDRPLFIGTQAEAELLSQRLMSSVDRMDQAISTARSQHLERERKLLAPGGLS